MYAQNTTLAIGTAKNDIEPHTHAHTRARTHLLVLRWALTQA